jgi:tRNA(Ile)-lysidine synthase
MNLEESLRRVITEERLINAGDRVLVGVSGGLDSSALLFILHNLKNTLSIDLAIAHVNHQLRGAESERDEAFVRGLAERFSVPFHSLRKDVKGYAKKAGISVQHAGRDIRYAFFSELADSFAYGKIAVAHNGDDQVETFLLRVVKGTGLKGLSSIPIRRGPIIRPFLRTYRSEIEEYATQHSVPHVEDSSNLRDGYERNFLRHQVTPLLEKLNPRFREKVLHLLSDIASLNAGFNHDTEDFLTGHTRTEGEEIRIPVEALKSLDDEIRFRVVSRLLSRLEPRFVALREHIGLVDKSLFSVRPNNMITLPHGIMARRVYGDMVFDRGSSPLPETGVFDIRLGGNSILPLALTLDVATDDERPPAFGGDKYTAILDADLVETLSVRTFREGDRFVPLGMTQHVKLKDYFMSRKIPREQRRRIPLLLSGQDIVWVVGERMDDRYRVTGKTTRFMRITAKLPQGS